MDTFYLKELDSYDPIFEGINQNFAASNNPINDQHYERDSIRIHVFKDFNESLYSVVDGIPTNVINRDLSLIRSTLNIKNSRSGVAVVKSFRITKINQNEIQSMLSYWVNNSPDLSDTIKVAIKNDLRKYVNNTFITDLKMRLINYVDEKDLRNNKIIFNSLLNGYLTKDLDNYGRNFLLEHECNKNYIEIELSSNGNKDFWMPIGNFVFPLKSSNSVSRNMIKIKNGNRCIMERTFENVNEYSIYTTEQEAYNNTESSILKKTKLNLEGEKINVEAQKNKLELTKLVIENLKISLDRKKIDFEKLKLVLDKEKALLDYKKTVINFRTEALKRELNTFNVIKDFLKTDTLIKEIIKTTTKIFKGE